MEAITSFNKSLWGFSPQSIPGMALWLDAQNPNSYTKTGTTLNSIIDISGSGTTFSGTTGTTIGSTLFNSNYPSFYSSAFGILGTTPTNTFSLPEPFTVFVVGLVVSNYKIMVSSDTSFYLGMNTTTYGLNTHRQIFNDYSNTSVNGTHTSPFFGSVVFTGNPSGYTNGVSAGNNGGLLDSTQSFFAGQNEYAAITSVSGNGTTVTVNFASTTTFIGITTITIIGVTGYNGTYTITSGPITGAITSLTYASTTTTTPTYSGAYVYYGAGRTQNGTLTIQNYGHLCEMMVFRGNNITTIQRQQIEGYLAWKWGLQANLPATHPYNSSLRITPFLRQFIPPDIPGCNLWLDGKDASTITLSGSSVTQWNDKSGNGYNAVGTAGSYPTYNSTTGALTFSSSFLNVANSTLTTSTTQSGFFVASITSPASGGSINTVIGPSPGSVGGLQIRFDSSFMRFLNAGITSYVTSTLTSPNATTSAGLTQLFGYVMSAGATSPYQNGVALSTGTVATLGSGNHVMLGARGTIGTTTEYLTGTICEVVLYSTALTTTQQQQIEGYLIWKWGLQRGGYYPSSAPFYNFPSATTSFNPLQISGLALWLDAADITTVITSGDNLTQWNDKSGNARNLTTKVGTITYGAYQGFNCIQNQNNSYIYKLNAVDLTQYTFFIVCLSVTNVTNQSVFSAIPQSSIYNSYNSLDSFGFYVDANTPRSRFYGSLLGNNVTDAAVSSNGNSYPLRITAYTETSGGTLNSYVNGATGLTQSTAVTRTNTCAGFALGANFNGTSANGASSVSYSHEILVYNSILTASQRQQVEGYLAWKWGLRASLPTTHPYYKLMP